MKMRKIGTRLLAGILMTMMVAVPVIAIEEQRMTEYERTGQLLSELTEEECLAFIASKGLEIPENMISPYNGELVKYLITRSEQYPQSNFGTISATFVMEFGEKVRAIVNEYYGVDGGKYYFVVAGDGDLEGVYLADD